MENKFEAFALVELFGHSKIAGLVRETTIAGGAFIRVDVPETPSQQAFSRLFNPSAIYAISPVDQVTCQELAERLEATPIQTWDVRRAFAKYQALAEGSTAEVSDEPF